MELTDERREKFERVASKRQSNFAVVLENIHDVHNIGAILRSCEAVGVFNIYIINTDPRLQNESKYKELSTSKGALKWMNIRFFYDLDEGMKEIAKEYDTILTTHLAKDSVSIYQTDLTGSVAFVLGNEHEGITEGMLAYADGNVLIPQMGLVQSLNVSVAAAVSLFEMMRQRMAKGLYPEAYDPENSIHKNMYESMFKIHFDTKYSSQE